MPLLSPEIFDFKKTFHPKIIPLWNDWILSHFKTALMIFVPTTEHNRTWKNKKSLGETESILSPLASDSDVYWAQTTCVSVVTIIIDRV